MKSFISALLLGLILTRVIVSIFFSISIHFPTANQQLIDDPFHHYQIGIILLLISVFINRQNIKDVLRGFGAGIVLEEAVVLLDDIGIRGARFFYLSYLDYIYFFIMCSFIFGCLFYAKKSK